MGPTHPVQIIRNRHFTSLELRNAEPAEKGRLVGTVAISSSALLEQWEKTFLQAQKQEHIHMLLPLEWRVAESNICGSGKLIELQFELFHRMLSEEAKLRSEQNRHFEQNQIWYIVWALTETIHQCSKNGARISDISLDNIFLNQTGSIKILTPLSIPDTFDPYFEPNVTNVYFSPEELKGRQLGQMYNESNLIKSTSFAAGMLLLSLNLLKPLFHIYDYDKNILNVDKLEEELQNLTKVQFLSVEFNIFQFYSDAYQRMLRKMLEIDPAKRITVSQVYEQLKPNLNEIATLKSFDFEVPQPIPPSPIKRNSLQKESISLGSHKLKKPSITQSPPAASQIKSEKPKEESPSPLIESKYVAGTTETKPLGSGLDLLRLIDERLMRSREQFPS